MGKGEAVRAVEEGIDLRDVSFRYPARPPQLVLDRVSIKIPAKQMTAIVGLSGSGKSTIASLIPRLYDVAGGQITIDGHDIRDMNLYELRRLIAVVEQRSALFQGSILENVAAGLLTSAKHSHLHDAILGGRLEAAVEATRTKGESSVTSGADDDVREIVQLVRTAIEQAEASLFVNGLQYGLATDAGYDGRSLSGGQVQRLGIARALIKDTPILILDEATASLDALTEREIQATIETSRAGKTIICIAHRLSTIQKADQVIALGNGRVLESGTPWELIQRDGHFAKMVQQQDVGGHSRASTVISSSSLPLVALKVANQLSDENNPAVIPEGKLTIDRPLETTPLLSSPSTAPATAASISSTEPLLRTFTRVVSLASSQRRFLLAGGVAASLAGIAAPINAILFGNMVGSMSPCSGITNVLSSGTFFGCAFLGLAAFDALSTTARGASFGRFSERVLLNSRILTFRSLFYQSIPWHETSGRDPNKLLSYLTTDANSLSAISGTLIGVTLSIFVNLGIGIVVWHVIAWKIASVLLGAVPLLLASGYLRIRTMARFNEQHREAFAQSVGVAKDAIDHIQTVALYSLEKHVQNTYQRSLRAPYEQTLRLIAVGNLWLAFSFGMSSLVYAFAYWWGAYQVQEGNYSNTQFFIVLPALMISAQQCGQLFTLAPDISRAGVAARQIFKQIDIGPQGTDIEEPQDSCSDLEATATSRPAIATSQNTPGMSIAFSNVSFSYANRSTHQILRDLDILIPADTLCAFTGPSGAGKSTLFSLILGHYKPSSGQVSLNGRSISDLPEESRDDIAVVPQESVLFNASIEFNVTIGLPVGATASRREVEEICTMANIHSVISKLPEGYDTIVGGTGSGLLSGGQKQRIALARALIRKPKLLLLDEATSALDAESERIWRDSLETLMSRQQQGGGVAWGRMTVVAIAHRLSTVRRAARISWIDAGMCEHYGTHEELYHICDGYRNAVDGQAFGTE